MEVTTETPIRSGSKSKPSNRLRVECLHAWLKDHKPFKPKPSILPDNINSLSEKFTLKKNYSNNHNH